MPNKEYWKEYHKQNRDKKIKAAKEWQEKNAEHRKKYMEEYREKNKEKWKRTPEQQAEINRRKRERYANDSEYREKQKEKSPQSNCQTQSDGHSHQQCNMSSDSAPSSMTQDSNRHILMPSK